MRKFLTGTMLSTAALIVAGSAYANDELIKLSQDAKQWVMPAGNYANTRHSTLKQITNILQGEASDIRLEVPCDPGCNVLDRNPRAGNGGTGRISHRTGKGRASYLG